MARMIDADARVTVQSFDVEHEEYDYTEMSVAEALDFATDEGCPPIIEDEPTVGGWVSVKDKMPETAGEYIVAYHPCHWDYVEWDTVLVGIDNFRGKTTWAKHKFQRVTHWMMKPEPPKEDD